MNENDQIVAKELYKIWFSRNPDIKNPSDINREEKFDFAVDIGWYGVELMQRARKANTKKNGFPFDWTKQKYWEGKNE